MLVRWKRIELMTNMEATNTKVTNTQKDEGMPDTKTEKKNLPCKWMKIKIELIITHTDTVPFPQTIDLIYNSIFCIYSSFVDFVNAFTP